MIDMVVMTIVTRRIALIYITAFATTVISNGIATTFVVHGRRRDLRCRSNHELSVDVDHAFVRRRRRIFAVETGAAIRW